MLERGLQHADVGVIAVVARVAEQHVAASEQAEIDAPGVDADTREVGAVRATAMASAA